jgi:hypothetical protein
MVQALIRLTSLQKHVSESKRENNAVETSALWTGFRVGDIAW